MFLPKTEAKLQIEQNECSQPRPQDHLRDECSYTCQTKSIGNDDHKTLKSIEYYELNTASRRY
jgi:hypothetical protein